MNASRDEVGPGGTYRGFKPRPPLIPITGGRVDTTKSFDYLLSLVGSSPSPPVVERAKEPFVGVTTDGVPLEGLFGLVDEGFDPSDAVDAAREFQRLLGPPAARRSALALDAPEWRLWTNAYPAWEPHGVLLDDLEDDQRDAALALVRTCLSSRGFSEVREAMALNGALGRLIGQYLDSLTEWMYWLTIFGEPSTSEPWGWQLSGHHVDVNCLIVSRQMVLTPTFLGSEFDSDRIFAHQRSCALELVSGLSNDQLGRALLYPSMEPSDLPEEIAGRVDGRHLGGAGQDNRIIPYAGICAAELTRGQREKLLELGDSFTGRLPEGPARHRRAAMEAHLDSTYFAWIGAREASAPFYFRIHSPVVLAEHDNHPGIFLDFDTPQPFHVHTIVRTPNGNDYGKDVLREHYAAHHGGERAPGAT